MKRSLYTLPHGIIVIGEYAPHGKNIYWRVRIRTHSLFDATIVSGGMCIRRSRVVMTSIVGRKLLKTEHIHHLNGNFKDDRPENLQIISPGEHNKHHKIGSSHNKETKTRIGKSLKQSYADGSRVKCGVKGEQNNSSKLKEVDIKEIRKSALSSRKLGEIYGVSKTNILSIKNRKIWSHVK